LSPTVLLKRESPEIPHPLQSLQMGSSEASPDLAKAKNSQSQISICRASSKKKGKCFSLSLPFQIQTMGEEYL
jgi:hypothetical protein